MENGIGCDYSEVIAGWQKFWKALDGKKHDFSKIVIPPKPEGKLRLLAMDDIASGRLYGECKKRFNCGCWPCGDAIDDFIIRNERDAKNGPYAIWVRDEVESGDFLVNIDPYKIKDIATETFNERLIHELIFARETGFYLDKLHNLTLCMGSPSLEDRFPLVGNHTGRDMFISWQRPYGFMEGRWHVRRVIC